jgi:hypothetical protein
MEPDSDPDEQQIRMYYGGGGAVLGLLLGWFIGSKVTLHTPLRRRR